MKDIQTNEVVLKESNKKMNFSTNLSEIGVKDEAKPNYDNLQLSYNSRPVWENPDSYKENKSVRLSYHSKPLWEDQKNQFDYSKP